MLNHRLLVAAVLAAYVALGLAAALTYTPRADEGFFASPALNLITHGHMGTTVLEGSHDFLRNIHRYTYWMTPLHFIVQAGWYELVGFSLLNMRLLSLLFGVVALGAWYAIAGRLSQSRTVAALTMALVSMDFNFIAGGASGRMDMMAAALNFSGLAAYLVLRDRNFAAAILAGNACATLAGLTHPVAGYLGVLTQIFVTLYLDRRRLTARLVALAAAPYLAGAAGWGLYILQDPEAFLAQFGTNAKMGGRLNGLRAPWLGVWWEVMGRYAWGYGLGGQSTGISGPTAMKALMLVLYVAGVAGAALTREVRKQYRVLLYLAAILFLALALLDSQKASYYLPHIIPYYGALTVAWLAALVRRGVPKWAPAAAVAAVMAVHVAGLVYRSYLNPYARTYAPAVEVVRKHIAADDLIFGNSSLAFGIGFDDGLVDDVRLGYHTGRKADVVVLDQEYRQAIDRYAQTEPELYRFIQQRIEKEYRPVYDRAGYRILIANTARIR
jgi:4-amino-4-deoxy-L-arabinose transferase-like glycosyltransferase